MNLGNGMKEKKNHLPLLAKKLVFVYQARGRV